MTRTEGQRALLEFHKSTSDRIEHMEKLLLGVATLGLAGWGLLHAGSFEVPGVYPSAQNATEQFTDLVGNTLQTVSWFVFTSFFSGLVGSAYAGLFIARMGINQTILEMEPHIESPVRPFTRYFEIVGKHAAWLVYFATGLFLPFLSIVSLGITSAWLYNSPISEISTVEVKPFIWFLICIMALSVISLSILMMMSIAKQLRWRSGSCDKQDSSTSRSNPTALPGETKCEQEPSDSDR